MHYLFLTWRIFYLSFTKVFFFLRKKLYFNLVLFLVFTCHPPLSHLQTFWKSWVILIISNFLTACVPFCYPAYSPIIIHHWNSLSQVTIKFLVVLSKWISSEFDRWICPNLLIHAAYKAPCSIFTLYSFYPFLLLSFLCFFFGHIFSFPLSCFFSCSTS